MSSITIAWKHEAPPHITFNLYENGEKVVSDIGALQFSLDMTDKTDGEYTYYATSFDTKTRLESLPSQSVTVNFTVPASPTGLSITWD